MFYIHSISIRHWFTWR